MDIAYVQDLVHKAYVLAQFLKFESSEQSIDPHSGIAAVLMLTASDLLILSSEK